MFTNGPAIRIDGPSISALVQRYRNHIVGVAASVAISGMALVFLTVALFLNGRISSVGTLTPVKPNVEACKEAMTSELNMAMTQNSINPNQPPYPQPPECIGLSQDQLAALAAQIISEKMNGN